MPAECGSPKNLFRAAVPAMFSPLDSTDVPSVSVVEVTWDDGDVLDTKHTGSSIQAGTSEWGMYVPDPAVEYVGYRVSALTVGAGLSYEEIRLAANDPSQQAE